MHRAEEDCLKNIYKLTIEKNNQLVKLNELAESLSLTDQTTNETVKRLVTKNMVNFFPYKGVNLTDDGLSQAVRLIKNHRLWEVFLVKNLGFSWSQVHDEAEKLEHASSKLLMEKIDKFLNYPTYCVHGNIIPRDQNKRLNRYSYNLKEVKVNETFIVKRVIDHQKLLEFLDQNNIYLNKELIVAKKDDLNQLITIFDENKSVVFSYNIAEMIFGDLKQI